MQVLRALANVHIKRKGHMQNNVQCPVEIGISCPHPAVQQVRSLQSRCRYMSRHVNTASRSKRRMLRKERACLPSSNAMRVGTMSFGVQIAIGLAKPPVVGVVSGLRGQMPTGEARLGCLAGLLFQPVVPISLSRNGGGSSLVASSAESFALAL